MANKNFPFDIRDVDEEKNKQLTSEFKGISKFIQVGPKKYTFPGKYAEEGSQYYNFKVRPDDVWVVTFPRSGTTFTQEMTWLLLNNFDYNKAKKIPLLDRFPFLDFSCIVEPKTMENILKDKQINPEENEQAANFGENILGYLDNLQERRFIKSHLPLSLLPEDLLTCGAKVVYVARNPKDMCVSYYHLFKLMEFYKYSGDFKQYWNFFEDNLIHWTPYWEHIKEAWDKRNDNNLLFLFYEDLIKDTPGNIRIVAKFLQKEVTDEDVATLHEHLKFDNFRKNDSVNFDVLRSIGVMKEGVPTFIRKGKTGSWREMFDEELNERANKWIKENLKRYEIEFPDNCQLGD